MDARLNDNIYSVAALREAYDGVVYTRNGETIHTSDKYLLTHLLVKTGAPEPRKTF